MATFRDTTVSRRGLATAGLLSVALPLAGAAAGPTAVLRQAHYVAALYEAENAACCIAVRLENQEGDDTAQEFVQAAYDEWQAATITLAEMPAEGLGDFLAKLAVVFQALRGGPGEAEGAVATSLMHDLWRLAPELHPLLRWNPTRPEFQA